MSIEFQSRNTITVIEWSLAQICKIGSPRQQFNRFQASIFFCPLYLYHKTMFTPQNLIFSLRYVVARHARVGQKTSDLNDAELLYLEGKVTLDRHMRHTLYSRCTTIRCAGAASPLLYRPLPAASIPPRPHPPPFPQFLIVYGPTWRK